MTQEPPLVLDPAASLSLVQRQLAKLFAAAGSGQGEAMTEARMLLCAALGIDHPAFLREAELPIGAQAAEIAERITAWVARRVQHEPVSRILGHREFWGLDLAIDPSVLDPRADTETLVEALIDTMAEKSDAPLRILDLGTGSGALLCALLANFSLAFGVGIDLSVKACAIAARNLDALGLSSRGKIVCGDWTKALNGSFDVIVSNPPYIAREEIATLDPDVREYDPMLALDGGDDGYAAYRTIIPALPSLLARDGVAVFELGIGQAKAVGDLLETAGLSVMGVKYDIAGIERAVVGKQG